MYSEATGRERAGRRSPTGALRVGVWRPALARLLPLLSLAPALSVAARCTPGVRSLTYEGVEVLRQRDPPRTVLAVGAHAGDMELTSGAVLAAERERGGRVVLLHLTLGERGNPRMSPDAYGAQKRREALAAAAALGAEVRFGPFRDGEVPNDEGARRYVAGVIRDVRPTIVITHWKHSIHRDHATTSAVVRDAVLLASLDGVAVDGAPYRGVRGVWYAENWEDREGFSPYVYVAVRDSTALARWRDAVTKYEFARGGVAPFPYLDYYQALAVVRGAEAHAGRAEAFDVDEIGKRRVLDSLP